MEVLIDGHVVLIDDEDLCIIKRRTWRVLKSWDKLYIRSQTTTYDKTKTNNHKTISFQLHREIAKAPPGMEVDHINGNIFDNRKANLRICTHQQNNWNKPTRRDSKTGLKGVNFDEARGKYQARIKINGKQLFLGRFSSAIEAHEAYKAKALELFGEYANFG